MAKKISKKKKAAKPKKPISKKPGISTAGADDGTGGGTPPGDKPKPPKPPGE